MSFAAGLARPPRCVLVNVLTGEAMDCLFNPTQLTEKLQVNWNRLAVPGLSHQVLQFQGTSNRQLSGVEFYLDAFFAAQQADTSSVMAFRAFVRALTVPPAGTEGVLATAPPRVLVLWPGVLTVECVVASVEFQYRQLAVDGRVLVYTATVTFEEVLDTRVTSEQLRQEVP
ncbi:peptidoglycan-binding protein [Corallococcus praedator]|uniref:Peptidoglycan-binding protein n=1 Tax=Corallococcus praedator TaxID=2316724 RepID=A0ABX9QJM1_9BACT|nr:MULTISPECIES: peptidoglycan-binding protein [Corallococcus]RKH35672.1 peptidoglycan-binding protein [Corallococcus sp. CA031C]RKI09645.1 peptidoglycan-binding protein [Corallococcus praedator]